SGRSNAPSRHAAIVPPATAAAPMATQVHGERNTLLSVTTGGGVLAIANPQWVGGAHDVAPQIRISSDTLVRRTIAQLAQFTEKSPADFTAADSSVCVHGALGVPWKASAVVVAPITIHRASSVVPCASTIRR